MKKNTYEKSTNNVKKEETPVVLEVKCEPNLFENDFTPEDGEFNGEEADKKCVN